MIIIPKEASKALIYAIYAVIGAVIFLIGHMLGVHQTTEDYLKGVKNEALAEARQKIQHLKSENEALLQKNEVYIKTYSGIRYLLRKGE